MLVTVLRPEVTVVQPTSAVLYLPTRHMRNGRYTTIHIHHRAPPTRGSYLDAYPVQAFQPFGDLGRTYCGHGGRGLLIRHGNAWGMVNGKIIAVCRMG